MFGQRNVQQQNALNAKKLQKQLLDLALKDFRLYPSSENYLAAAKLVDQHSKALLIDLMPEKLPLLAGSLQAKVFGQEGYVDLTPARKRKLVESDDFAWLELGMPVVLIEPDASSTADFYEWYERLYMWNHSTSGYEDDFRVIECLRRLQGTSVLKTYAEHEAEILFAESRHQSNRQKFVDAAKQAFLDSLHLGYYEAKSRAFAKGIKALRPGSSS